MKNAEFKLPNPDLRCSYCRSKKKLLLKYTKIGYPNKYIIAIRCCDCGKTEYFSSTVDDNIFSIMMSPYTINGSCQCNTCPNKTCEYRKKPNIENPPNREPNILEPNTKFLSTDINIPPVMRESDKALVDTGLENGGFIKRFINLKRK